ncbi:hypothetical protein GW915_04015 [bacterium]|nr:hypothetical protein [bacterium]
MIKPFKGFKHTQRLFAAALVFHFCVNASLGWSQEIEVQTEKAKVAHRSNSTENLEGSLDSKISSARNLRQLLKSKNVHLESARLVADALAPEVAAPAMLAHYMDQKEAGQVTINYVKDIAGLLKSERLPEGINLSDAQAQQYASLSNLIALLEAQKQIGKLKAADESKLAKLKDFQLAFIFDLSNHSATGDYTQTMEEILQFKQMRSAVLRDLPALNLESKSPYPVLLQEQALQLEISLKESSPSRNSEERYSSQLEFHDTTGALGPVARDKSSSLKE